MCLKHKGGSNSPDNLTTLCADCHHKLHTGEIKLKKKPTKSYKDAASVNIAKGYVLAEIKELGEKHGFEVFETFGYATQYVREELLHLPKTHINDAYAIAVGENIPLKMTRCNSSSIQFRRQHNRQLYLANTQKAGYRKSCHTYHAKNGFRLGDIVKFKGKVGYVAVRRTGYLKKSGKRSRSIGIKFKDGTETTTTKLKNVQLLVKSRGMILL